ncbi:MAG: radical SAM protein, partial [Caldisericia bacterium]
VEVVKLLDGYVDIYLPDMKYFDDDIAQEISSVSNYVQNNKEALIEMWNQVGELELDDYGIAKKGLIIRHLVLPENKSNSDLVLKWIAEKISYARISLMSQYFPAHKAVNYPGLDRKITKKEYDFVVKIMEEGGLNGWIQPIQ